MSILDSIPYIPCHPKNYGGARAAGQIKYLIYHYTGNDGDRDSNNARYYRDNVVQTSAHYFVDDDSVVRSVPDLRVAWAVGGKKWSDCAKTGGGTMYGVITNANSLSIEMCDTQRDGKLMATQATLERAAQLGRALMEKYHIDIHHVYRHFDVTGKHCPAYFMDSAAWETFKRKLVQGDEEVTQERFNEMFEAALAAHERKEGEKPVAGWARTSWGKAKEKGLVDGSRPLAGVTRQELAVVLDRAGMI